MLFQWRFYRAQPQEGCRSFVPRAFLGAQLHLCGQKAAASTRPEKPVLIAADSLHESILSGDTPEVLPELALPVLAASRYPNTRTFVRL